MDAIRTFLDQGKAMALADLSVSQLRRFSLAETAISDIEQDADKIEALHKSLPRARLEMVFEYSDTAADMILTQPLLMSLSPDSNSITLRIDFAPSDMAKLLQDYSSRRLPEETSLKDVVEANIHAYYGFHHYKVSDNRRTAFPLSDGGIRHKLIKLDKVPAQRHVDDQEEAKSAKLSKLLHAHYIAYVKPEDQAAFDAIEDAVKQSANELTQNYKAVFGRLIDRLRGFGYPQGSAKPDLDIRAEMTSETIYKDNTRIYYAASGETGEDAVQIYLPERYNGLGYKNLIYIVLQLESFRAALDASPEARPGVHLIGIEEPEAHLHPQMQAVFVSELASSLAVEGGGFSAQVILSTHSSHIVSDSGFSPIRYFQKKGAQVRIRDLSRLGDAIPASIAPTGEEIAATLKFLKRYIKLTHCDLLFADKAILVEGRVEKLLMPEMIEKISSQEGFAGFDRQFVTVLKMGGDYAHKIDPLLQFIGIPTLVIADIDSADAKCSPCPVAEGVCSTNAVIGSYLKEASDLKALHELTFEGKRRNQTQVAFQIEEDGECGRSFEEAFIYANLGWISANVDLFTAAKAFKKALETDLAAEAYELGCKKLTKVEFALDLLGAEGWAVPAYIREGLEWLSEAERVS